MTSRQPFKSNSTPKTSIIFFTVTISSSLVILFAILYFIYYVWYSLVNRSRTSPYESTTPLNKLQRYSYKELKDATQNFSDSNSIGKGGSGTVFRGILKDGKLVAIKTLDSTSFQFEQEFQNELNILGGLKSCPLVVNLLGYCVDRDKRLVVYEYMPNKSLQESLFSESNNNSCNNMSLSWARRFDIILSVAKALSFLHLECDPPVIHGDVKPSNVLLDAEFRAKLSDFGLSRLKLEGEFGVDLFSQDLWKSQELLKSEELSGNLNAVGDNETPAIGTPVESHDHDEVDFALALQASSSSKNSCRSYHNVKNLALSSLNWRSDFGNEIDTKDRIVKGKEVSTIENGKGDDNKSANYNDDLSSNTSPSKELNLNADVVRDDSDSKNVGSKQWGKDWWWKQDGNGELCSKDYVKEWIGSQIYPSSNSNWDEENQCPPSRIEEKANDNPSQEPGFEYPDGAVEKEESKRWKVHTKKHRKMQEWWREEHLDELSKKNNKANKFQTRSTKLFKVRLNFVKRFKRRRKSSHESHDMNDPDMEFSFRKGCKKKDSRSVGSDMWSGDLFSRELSSTTSMRGTLCYAAPEYSGCGYLMEKADIYSFGVLILVIVSGRRPLHVLSSPMKLEKANLVSWCRHLAHAGNVLELVDEKLNEEYNREEASLCINLALACLQKMPELRPDIGEIIKILKRETEIPLPPFEFSPSPPPKFPSRSRRNNRTM